MFCKYQKINIRHYFTSKRAFRVLLLELVLFALFDFFILFLSRNHKELQVFLKGNTLAISDSYIYRYIFEMIKLQQIC
jgi:hypothetical protein